MRKVLALLLLMMFCMSFNLCSAEAADKSDFETLFSAMSIDELTSIRDTLQQILNQKIIGNAKLIVSPSSTSIAKGDKLSFSIESEGREITKKTKISYLSSDESVISITNNVMKAVGAGNATITITATFEDDGILEEKCDVAVYAPVASVKIAASNGSGKSGQASSAKLVIGGKMNIAELTSVLPEDATEKGIQYTIDNEEVAEISDNGLLTAKAKGNVVVTATSMENSSKPKSASLKISILQPVEKIELEESRFNVGNGSTHKLTYKVMPENADDQNITWVSDDPDIAAVSKAGVVTGKGTGTCTITGTANDGSGVTATAEVTVITAVKKIALSDKTLSLIVGDSDSVSAEVTPQNATDTTLLWSSSDESVATVDTYGTIKAKSSGKCTITASAADGSGASASIAIFVEPHLPVYVSSIHWQTTWGQKNGKMGVEAESECVNKTIKSFDYTVECTNIYGSTATSYLTYDGPTIKPGMSGKSKLTKSTVSGFSNAYSVKITPTKVYFSDGTSVTIPSEYRYTSNFTM